MRRVSAREAYDLLQNERFLYLDVRSPPEFAEGHPAGARNVPWAVPSDAGMSKNPGFLEQVRERYALDAPLLVGCASGVRSLEAVKLLEDAGFTHLVELRPGYLGVRDPFGRLTERGWRDEGLPVGTGLQEDGGNS